MHADGTLARGDSTASIETVAETFDALLCAAQIQNLYPSALWTLSASELLSKAAKLRELLFEHMWLGDRFALGTERTANGDQVPLDSQASNQARLLDSLILDGPDYWKFREVIANALMDPGLLGATGLRTLSAKHVSYRAGGYHTGSAWPMDGVFAARGLLRQGFAAEAHEISTRIKSSIELIGGYPEFFRSDYPEHGLITSSIIDVVSDQLKDHEQMNRINQPPQIIQGWTVGAYAWLSQQEGLENGAKR